MIGNEHGAPCDVLAQDLGILDIKQGRVLMERVPWFPGHACPLKKALAILIPGQVLPQRSQFILWKQGPRAVVGDQHPVAGVHFPVRCIYLPSRYRRFRERDQGSIEILQVANEDRIRARCDATADAGANIGEGWTYLVVSPVHDDGEP